MAISLSDLPQILKTVLWSGESHMSMDVFLANVIGCISTTVSAVCGISIMQAYELSYEDKREGWVFFCIKYCIFRRKPLQALEIQYSFTVQYSTARKCVASLLCYKPNIK